MSRPAQARRPLRPSFVAPLADRWTAPGGPWTATTLDELLTGSAPPTEEAEVDRVAGGLAAAGVRPGDAVAWQLPNGAAAALLFRATWRLGAVACPIHHLAGTADVAATTARLAPVVVIRSESEVPTASPITAAVAGHERVDAAAVALALGTSGSTGTPKVVLHTHRTLVHKARSMARVHGLDHRDTILLPVPMAHISGLLNGVLLRSCGMRVLPMARWDAATALDLVEAEGVTFMVGPPTFFVSMMGVPGFAPRRTASLRQVSCGGAGVTPAFALDASSRLGGARVKRSYGSTEAPTVTTSTLDDPVDRAVGTDGRAVEHVDLRIADGGELWVRGPELCAGYDDPEATAAAFTDDGWFRTGDLAVIEDGWLRITGRLKDVIIRGGENIATAEVEAVLEGHPSVREAVAIGVPDERLGERVCAVVTPVGALDLGDCRAWFEGQGVTRFKWPERIETLDELPLLPSGKPDRAGLRRRFSPPPD